MGIRYVKVPASISKRDYTYIPKDDHIYSTLKDSKDIIEAIFEGKITISEGRIRGDTVYIDSLGDIDISFFTNRR